MADIPVRCTMASIVVIRGKGDAARVLLVRRASPNLRGVWSYVAGHLEAGEMVWQCALRELVEETALRPTALYSADSCEQFYDVQAECIQLVPAFVAIVADDALVQLNGEHNAHCWLDFSAAIDALPFGGQRDLFAHVQREFVQRVPSVWLRLPLPDPCAP
ncbi:MAG: NUDIX domain-containing protein [Rhodanobacter sp.]